MKSFKTGADNGLKPKRCPECKAMMEVKPGWESKEALVCPKCGEYEYYVGNIRCIKTAHFAPLRKSK